MRLTDEMVELDDRKYRDRNFFAELKYMGREIKHRKTTTNDDLRFMAWLCRSALNLLKEQEAKPVVDIADSIDGLEVGRCPLCDRGIVNKKSDPTRYCKFCGQAVKWNA